MPAAVAVVEGGERDARAAATVDVGLAGMLVVVDRGVPLVRAWWPSASACRRTWPPSSTR